MHVALVVIALQLRVASTSSAHAAVDVTSDSAHTISDARASQADFERHRRFALPRGFGAGRRCDVRLGRFCWWYDDGKAVMPPEQQAIKTQRTQLIALLDSAAARYPGDDWLAGMRVYYRVEGKDTALAIATARACRATRWWCEALRGYANHAAANEAVADSVFSQALLAMPQDSSCAWRNIAPLLSGRDRDVYERTPCANRDVPERRFWLLSQPSLASSGNDARSEFMSRHVIMWLAAQSATPHLIRWGDDAAELVLRYGWPVAWSRQISSGVNMEDAGVVGHDPTPSFVFAPRGWLADSLRPVLPSAWDFDNHQGESRFSPRNVKRTVSMAVQVARFRRGDSVLVVSAYHAQHDSLRTVSASLAAATIDGARAASRIDTSTFGTARVTLPAMPFVAGVDVTDSMTQTLARAHVSFVPRSDSGRIALSDILAYRADGDPASTIEGALAGAIAGDTVTRNRPLGLFWETYGLAPSGESVEVAVSVERVDRGWIRSARQRLGLTPVDTPIRMQWTDARPPLDRGAPHAVSLDLTNLDSGRYRITLSVTSPGEAAVTSVKEVELIEH